MHWILWLLAILVTGFVAFFNPNFIAANWLLNQSQSGNVTVPQNCSNIFIKMGNSYAQVIGSFLCSAENLFMGIAKNLRVDSFHLAFTVMLALLVYLLVEHFLLRGAGDWVLKIVIFVILLLLLGVL